MTDDQVKQPGGVHDFMSFFSYATLDRQAPLREQADDLQQRLHGPDSRILIWHEGKLLPRETLATFLVLQS